MLRRARSVSASLLVLCAVSGRAHADPSSVGAPPAEPRHFVFGSGLALVMSRLAVGYETFPWPRHSLGLTVHGQAMGLVTDVVRGGAFIGAGAEVGYRFYGHRGGPAGPFVGVSFLGGHYYSRTSLYRADPLGIAFFQFGPALDAGWAFTIDRDIVVALSLGAQLTWIDVSSDRLSEVADWLVGEGIRPRAHVQVGKKF